MLAAIVLFTYNRPKHTEETIKSLIKNRLFNKSKLYIFSDGYKNENDKKQVLKTREVIEKIIKDRENIELVCSERNKGLAASVISGVTKIINQYERVIVLEDDLITTKNFLEYMNQALEYYEKDNRIGSISGYSFKFSIPKNYDKDIFVVPRGCSWGWATWKDRWNKIDWEIKDYNEFKNNFKLRKAFNSAGRDLSLMLDDQMEGKIDSWAIRWCYNMHKEGLNTIYPIKSYIKNKGLDGSGTHKANTNRYNSIMVDDNYNIKLENVKIDKEILNKFRDYYGDNTVYFKIFIAKKVKAIIRKVSGER